MDVIEIRQMIVDTFYPNAQLADEQEAAIAQAAILHYVNQRTSGAFFDSWEDLLARWKTITS